MNLSREQLNPIMDLAFELSQQLHALMDNINRTPCWPPGDTGRDWTWDELHSLAQLASIIFHGTYREWLAAPPAPSGFCRESEAASNSVDVTVQDGPTVPGVPRDDR